MKKLFLVSAMMMCAGMMSACSNQHKQINLESIENTNYVFRIDISDETGVLIFPRSGIDTNEVKYSISGVKHASWFTKKAGVTGYPQILHINQLNVDLDFTVALGRYICSNCYIYKLPNVWSIVPK